jgi:hypothetical protein
MNGRTMHMLLTTTFFVSLAVVPAEPAGRAAERALAAEVASLQAHPAPPAPARPGPAPRPAPRPGPAEQAKGAVPVTDRTVHELRLGPDGELDLANIAGDITITAAKGADVRIEVVRTVHRAPGMSDEAAQQLLEQVQVDVIERGNRAEVRVRYAPRDRGAPGRRGMSASAAYEVTAPPGTRIRAQSISGAITASGIQGESSYESVSGTVRISNGGRVASAKSISGSVEVTDTAMDSTFLVSSASGSITLQRVKARRADISSISGNLQLTQVDAERIEAQTVSGRVQLEGALRKDGRYQLRSHSGDLHVAIADTPGFDLDARTFSGAVRTELPITTRTDDSGPHRSRALRGVHGEGGAVLDLTTFSGAIVLTRK